MPGFRDGWEDVRKEGEGPGMTEGPSTWRHGDWERKTREEAGL